MITVLSVLFTTLNTLLASAAFRRSWGRRMSVSVGTVVVVGIVVFVAAFVPFGVGSWQSERAIQQSYRTTQHDLPVSFAEAETLTLDLQNLPSAGIPQIRYTVSDTLRYELSHSKGVEPQFDIVQKDKAATVVVGVENGAQWHHYHKPVLHMYGPALNVLEVKGGAVAYENDTTQKTVALVVEKNAAVTLEGAYTSVEATARDDSQVRLESATVTSLRATTAGGSIEAGVVQDLEVSQPTACPARSDDQNSIELVGVVSGEVRYNGEVRPLTGTKSIGQPCGVVEIDEE